MFECDIAHRRYVAVLCMFYKIRCNPMHPLNDALPGQAYVPVRVTRGALVTHRYTYAPPCTEPRSTARLFFPSRCSTGTILLTQYSMVWDWRVSRAGPMLFYCRCSISTILFYSFSLSILPVYRLVLWGWGLRTDRMYITLSQPCTANLYLIIIIITR